MMHAVDIAIIWFLLYKIIQFVEGTRALQILLGVGAVILINCFGSHFPTRNSPWP